MEQTIEHFGRIDASSTMPGSPMKKLTARVGQGRQTNLNSSYHRQGGATQFIEQSSGKIINISSFVSQAGADKLRGGEGRHDLYQVGGTKLAHNVCVNAICPGFMETDMLRRPRGSAGRR